MNYLMPYDSDGNDMAKTDVPTFAEALIALGTNIPAENPKEKVTELIKDKVDDYLTDELFNNIKDYHKYVRVVRIVLEDKLSDAFPEVLDVLGKENPLPNISQTIQDTIPVIGSYF